MEARSARLACASVLAGVFTIAVPALAQVHDEPPELDLDGNIRLGVRYLDVDGNQAKFNEYRNLSDGVGVAAEEVMLRGYYGAYHFFVEGVDLDRDDDRSATAEGGRYGQFEVELGWDQTPHNFANDVPFLGTLQGGDTWVVPDIVRSALQPEFPLGGDPPNTPTAIGVADLLALLDDADRLDLSLVRKTETVALSYTPLRDLELRTEYLHRKTEGLRPMSAGVYRRDADGAFLVGGVGENFMTYGLEFPEPIDYEENDFGSGGHYRGSNWSVEVGYRLVLFGNENDSVTWDDPLALTGTNGIQYGAALNRLDLYPSHMSNTVTASGGIWDLPFDSSVALTASWGRIAQDDDFLAFTVNDVLTVGTAPPVPASGQLGAAVALPQNDLNGEVDKILVNAVLSSRPIDSLTTNVKFNYYDYNDRSDRMVFTNGWARVGESQWPTAEAGVENRVPDWERIRTGFDAKYRFGEALSLIGDYGFERYVRNHARNADTDEHVAGGRLELAPTSWATLRASYHFADRHIDGSYQPFPNGPGEQFFEWEELRMFDQSDRKRNRAEVYLSLSPLEPLSIGASASYEKDDYEEDFFGLQKRDGYTLGVDAGYAFGDRASVFAYYSRDDYDSKTLIRSKSNAAGGGSFAISPNDFLTRIADTANTIGAGFSFTLIPEKLTLEVEADYSFAKSKFDTSNPDFVAGVTTSGATAFDWPDTDITTTLVRTDLEYHWTEELSTGVRYMYERYDLDDAFTDTVSPYPNPPDAQGNRLDYFIFLDANYSDYRAHLVTFTVSYEF